MSYGELRALVWRCSDALQRAGVGRGDRIAMLAPPCWQQIAVFLAAAHAGAIFVGLNPRHSLPELEYVVRDSEPVLLFHARSLAAPGHGSIRRTVEVDC